MTDDTAPSNGASESSRIARGDDNQTVAEDADGLTREELAAANDQLRERVAALEDALADVQSTLAEQSADTAEASSEPASGPADTPDEATADPAPALVTSGGQPTKVIGKLSDDQGIGVLGEATATSTVTYGIQGITQSSASDAAGVRANAPNGGLALEAKAQSNNAIYAETDASSFNGIFGNNTASSGPSWGVRGDTSSADSDAYGVRGKALSYTGTAKGMGGETYGSGNGAAGVEGIAQAGSGVTYGVKGQTYSPDGYGLYTPDDASVDGSMSVGNVGVSTYLGGGDQTVNSSTDTTVAFNETVVDHFGGMDTSTGVYTVQEAGDYHISVGIDWASTFNAGVTVIYDLEINGSTNAQGLSADTTTQTSGQGIFRHFSRTAFGLGSGDTIQVEVRQNSDSQKDIYGYATTQETYMTIHKVG